MSRIGKKPVAIPEGVKFTLQGRLIQVEGPLGKLQFEHRPEVSVNYDEQNRQVLVSRHGDDRLSRALHGTTRAIIQNMVVGVTKGYEKRLEVVGSGYLAALQGDTLELRVGFANEVRKKVPPGLQVTVPDQTHSRWASSPRRCGRCASPNPTREKASATKANTSAAR